MQRVADVCIAAHVLVQGFDPYDLRACRGQVGDASLVARVQECWRVVVTVLHVNHHFNKVLLDWNLLVTYLRGSSEISAFVSVAIRLSLVVKYSWIKQTDILLSAFCQLVSLTSKSGISLNRAHLKTILTKVLLQKINIQSESKLLKKIIVNNCT